MRSGLARFGYAGLISILLVPVIVAAGVRIGVRSYCAKMDRTLVAQAATLSRAVEMELALQQARTAIRSLPKSATGDLTGTEEFGRWLREAGKQQHLVLQNLTFNKDPAANPLTPALTASFRVEQSFPRILLLLHRLQDFQRLILYDSISLRSVNQLAPPVYLADVTLHAYSIKSLKPKIEP